MVFSLSVEFGVVVVVVVAFIGSVIHLQSRDLHLSHNMKFRYTMKECT